MTVGRKLIDYVNVINVDLCELLSLNLPREFPDNFELQVLSRPFYEVYMQ